MAEVPALGALERQVMEVLWDCPDDLCTRDVLAAMTAHTLAYTTVATVLTNLTRKGMVERVQVGRRWVFRPLRSREGYAAEVMLAALDGARDRSRALAELRQMLDPAERAALCAPEDAVVPRGPVAARDGS
ncbi:BlaI/MecI/CopY family transcriptional regulator [Cellulomonas sp. APG4]|uniref:BlaI/MecI/CopY family transcriptional regulator n=1 Tax=Cellulomonas sp. APG4 TaxID=1538656 RepID=UPI0013797DB1|nr:BlaI/MecI/CopY family transcriptional regulator [Cellulomonas sp. APG4]